ncbi:MAG: lipase family protein [Planctomycetaceae bacterium]|nr:lipase family protein [Planctomycetaceae bacterium]
MDSAVSNPPSPRRVATPLRIKFTGAINDLSLLRRSLLFAEFSRVAYYDHETVARLVEPIGFHLNVEFFDRNGAQAYRLDNATDVVIVCRGTEPHETTDIRADIDAAKVVAETVGHVHRGFKGEVDQLWPMIKQSLQANRRKRVWFCGHSLGGAMATISAGRCFISEIPSAPEALFTYGSPRVGTKRYINYCRIQHIRWVNNNDIVPRLPPAWLGFRHSGREMYLNRHGELCKLDYWGKASDRIRGFIHTLGRFRIDWLSDHSINSYIDAIVGLCERAEAAGYHDEVPLAKFWRRSLHATGQSRHATGRLHTASGAADRLTSAQR